MKRLLICRHAKSSWKDQSVSDFERPLNKRGKRDAPLMGQRLYVRQTIPELIMTSSANRALTTALHYAHELGYPAEQIMTNSSQYAAGVAQLVALIQTTSETVTTLMIMGHNPESTHLANYLSGLQIDNIPTCGIVALEFSQESWQDIDAACGKLLFFDFPNKVY
nr:histidine phosphatase family protein [uncultured Desulfobulbus sp.]